MDIPSEVIDWLNYGAFWAWIAFLVTYTVVADWWKSPIGRNVFGTAVLLASIFGLISLARVNPEFEIRPFLQVLVYGAGVVFGAQRTYHVIKAQRDHRDDEAPVD